MMNMAPSLHHKRAGVKVAVAAAAFNEQGRGHNGKLHLQFTWRDWLGTGPWPGVSSGSSYADTGYQASWEATRGQSGGPGILVFYSGGSTTDEDARSRLTAAELEPASTSAEWAKLSRRAGSSAPTMTTIFPGAQGHQ
jgi:hypothetical protein